MPALCGYVRLRPSALGAGDALDRMAHDQEAGNWQMHGRYVQATDDVGVHSWQFGSDSPTASDGDNSLIIDGYVLNRATGAAAAGVEKADASDAALLHALWKCRGTSSLQEIEGDFNFVAIEPDRLTLVSSRLGARHLYWYVCDDYVAFATRMEAITRLPGFSSRVDRLAMMEMFNFGYVGADRSMLDGVRLLPAASCVTIKYREGQRHSTGRAEKIDVRRYWHLEFDNADTVDTFDQLVEEGVAAYRDSVQAHLERFGQVVVPLSGGLDSRTLLAFAAEGRQSIQVHHCNWYAGEAQIARQLAQVCGAQWKEHDPLQFDYAAMLADGDHIAQGNIHNHQFWFLPIVQTMISVDGPQIVLDGYLMDVLFGDTFLILPDRSDSSQTQTRQVINRLWRRCRPDLVRRVFSPRFYEEYEESNAHSINTQLRSMGGSLTNQVQAFSFENRSNRYSVALPNVQRQYVDYAYPGTSLKLVDLYRRIPPHFKAGARFARAVVSRAAPGVAAVSWAKTGRPLNQDKSAVDRLLERLPLKQAATMFMLRASAGKVDLSHRADLNRHFRRHAGFRRAFLDVAEDERTLSRGTIDRSGLQRLVGMIDKGWPVLFLLQALVTVEMFHRRFTDSQGATDSGTSGDR